MATFDWFDTTKGLFSPISLTDTILKANYYPRKLGQLGIFQSRPVDTISVAIEELRDGTALIPISKRGGPAPQARRNMRQARKLDTIHLKMEETINADEIPVRALGTETGIETMAEKVNYKMALLKDQKFEPTFEYLRAFAVQGLVKDPADGSTVVNMFDQFGVKNPVTGTTTALSVSTQNLTLSAGTTDIRNQVVEAKRTMRQVLGMDVDDGCIGLLSPGLFDKFIAHATVRAAWNNAQQLLAVQTHEDLRVKGFYYAGVTWFEYASGFVPIPDADTGNPTASYQTYLDNSGNGTGLLLPPPQTNIFRVYYAPDDTFDGMGKMGTEYFAYSILNDERTHIRIIAQSNPLFVCLRPDAVVHLAYN